MSVHGTVSTCDYQMGQECLISFSFELDSKRLKKSGKRHELCFFYPTAAWKVTVSRKVETVG